jgi:hypothetical protein
VKLRAWELLAVKIDVDEVFAADNYLARLAVEDFSLAWTAADVMTTTIEGKEHQ